MASWAGSGEKSRLAHSRHGASRLACSLYYCWIGAAVELNLTRSNMLHGGWIREFVGYANYHLGFS